MFLNLLRALLKPFSIIRNFIQKLSFFNYIKNHDNLLVKLFIVFMLYSIFISLIYFFFIFIIFGGTLNEVNFSNLLLRILIPYTVFCFIVLLPHHFSRDIFTEEYLIMSEIVKVILLPRFFKKWAQNLYLLSILCLIFFNLISLFINFFFLELYISNLEYLQSLSRYSIFFFTSMAGYRFYIIYRYIKPEDIRLEYEIYCSLQLEKKLILLKKDNKILQQKIKELKVLKKRPLLKSGRIRKLFNKK